jgi:hypothetical protein
MNLSELFDSTFCLHLTLVLVHFLWQGLVIGAIGAMAAWCLRGASAQSRYLVHVTTLLLMVACLPVTFAVMHATVSKTASAVPEVKEPFPAEVFERPTESL